MVENILKRAKQFIGIEEGVEVEGGQRIEASALLKGKEKKGSSEHFEYRIIVYEPKVYEDSLSISGELRQGNPVVINLKHLDPSEGTRLIDFVCGTAYAIDGHMVKIGESIFLFTPNKIQITDIEGRGGLEEETEVERGRERFWSRK